MDDGDGEIPKLNIRNLAQDGFILGIIWIFNIVCFIKCLHVYKILYFSRMVFRILDWNEKWIMVIKVFFKYVTYRKVLIFHPFKLVGSCIRMYL